MGTNKFIGCKHAKVKEHTSHVAIQSIEHKQVFLQVCRLSHLSVSVSGTCTMPKWLIGSGCHFGWWVGSDALDGVIIKGNGQFWDKCGTYHCNQLGLYGVLFSAVRGGDVALPKLLWDFLLIVFYVITGNITYLILQPNGTNCYVTI